MTEAKDETCAVIVTVDAPAAILADMVSHARHGLARFQQFAGFISGTLHIAAEQTRIVQYLLWASEAHHLACMNDPVWNELESTRRFMGHIASGAARMDVRVYRIVETRAAKR